MIHGGYRCALHLDDSPETLETIAGERFAEVASRGVMTPEHILRAGVRPLIVALEYEQTPVEAQQREDADPITDEYGGIAAPLRLEDQARDAIQAHRREYGTYAGRHGVTPIPDFLKTIVVPGLGIVYAGKDRRNALIAADCYTATMRVMAGAEAVERFEFLSEDDAFEMEYWPLERRKIEESAKARKDLEGKVALIIGAASGIGRAAALSFAEEGAHVSLADLNGSEAEALATQINAHRPDRAAGTALNASDGEALASVVQETVLAFGGIDVLFYSPGIAPELHSVTEMPDQEIERQMAVHYRGAVAATREVSRVMLAQGDGRAAGVQRLEVGVRPGRGRRAVRGIEGGSRALRAQRREGTGPPRDHSELHQRRRRGYAAVPQPSQSAGEGCWNQRGADARSLRRARGLREGAGATGGGGGGSAVVGLGPLRAHDGVRDHGRGRRGGLSAVKQAEGAANGN